MPSDCMPAWRGKLRFHSSQCHMSLSRLATCMDVTRDPLTLQAHTSVTEKVYVCCDVLRDGLLCLNVFKVFVRLPFSEALLWSEVMISSIKVK